MDKRQMEIEKTKHLRGAFSFLWSCFIIKFLFLDNEIQIMLQKLKQQRNSELCFGNGTTDVVIAMA